MTLHAVNIYPCMTPLRVLLYINQLLYMAVRGTALFKTKQRLCSDKYHNAT